MEGNCGDIVDTFTGLLVQCLDVAERVGETQARGADLVRGQSIEHEGVIGVGAVSHGDLAELSGRVLGGPCSYRKQLSSF